jgi:Protein of unknown function (DUF2946)
MRAKSLRRRLVSWVAVYALALHSILVAFVVPLGAASAADAAAGFEICLHDAGTADQDRGAPDRHANGESHCKFCVAGGASFVTPTQPALPWTLGAVAEPVMPARAGILPPSPETFCEQPRGPPFGA